ncbi:MAG TPA: MerC domain-containing protein [Edaphobacter sp.]
MGSLLSSSQTSLRRHADLAGAAASGLCLVHCLLTPFLISLAPDLLPYLPGDAWFHRMLAVGIVLLGAVAFIPGYRIHQRKPLLIPISLGVVLILFVACCGEALSKPVELILNVSGSLLLVIAHLLNRSFCRQCHTCADSLECHTTQIS